MLLPAYASCVTIPKVLIWCINIHKPHLMGDTELCQQTWAVCFNLRMSLRMVAFINFYHSMYVCVMNVLEGEVKE